MGPCTRGSFAIQVHAGDMASKPAICLVNNAMHWLGSYTVLLVLENMLLYCAIGLFIYRYIEERWWGFSCLMVLTNTHVHCMHDRSAV